MPRNYRSLHISATDGSFAYDAVPEGNIIGPIDYAWSLGDAGKKFTTFGSGPIAGSFVPGSNRLVVAGWSPLWESFYPSTIGGAGLPWEGIGANFLALDGRAAQPSILRVENFNGKVEVELIPVDVEAVWRGYEDERGLYALMHKAYDDHGKNCASGRVLAVGPAAARTKSGAIGSAAIKKGLISNVDTWAGRGGLGSRLYRTHNVVALVYGGDHEDEDLTDRKMVDGVFDERFGKPLKLVDLEKTTKYRFDPKFKTGGTFGSNYHSLREKVLSFNYSSVLMSDDVRTRIHERLIAGHYLKQFDEEIIAKKNHYNCGEPCGAVCKKVDGKFKKDYEPYQAMGPLIGVFDQRAAEQLNRYADACGFDAIQIGGEVSWVMECLREGWLGEAETGIADRPHWEPDQLDAVVDSAHNARMARDIIAWILDDPRAAAMREGLRVGSRAVGGKAAQAAVYNANGDSGCMVPNQYWVPGMFAPVPIMGRYYLDYGYDWRPPRELGKSCADRMIKELMLDNYGMCRFHRGWAEAVLPDLINRFQGCDVDPDEHHRALALEFHGNNRSQPWQTDRVVDMIHTYLLKYRADGPKEPDLDAWLARFARDKQGAARAYWQEMRDGFDEGLKTPPKKAPVVNVPQGTA